MAEYNLLSTANHERRPSPINHTHYSIPVGNSRCQTSLPFSSNVIFISSSKYGIKRSSYQLGYRPKERGFTSASVLLLTIRP